MSENNPRPTRMAEEFNVRGEQLVEKVRELIHAGNVRRVIVKREGRVVIEFPVTVGVVGVVLAPQLAMLGVIAALLTNCTIEVVRSPEHPTASS
ncbi:MAG: DUF4342 domain-containing protein [Chloroflexota bacterium]